MASKKQRRARSGHAGATRTNAAARVHPATLPIRASARPASDWRWRSFPVFFAFVAGMLLAFLSNGATSNPVAFVLLIGALLGFGYGLAHLVINNVVFAGRARRQGSANSHANDFEEELVYPEEHRGGSERGEA